MPLAKHPDRRAIRHWTMVSHASWSSDRLPPASNGPPLQRRKGCFSTVASRSLEFLLLASFSRLYPNGSATTPQPTHTISAKQFRLSPNVIREQTENR